MLDMEKEKPPEKEKSELFSLTVDKEKTDPKYDSFGSFDVYKLAEVLTQHLQEGVKDFRRSGKGQMIVRAVSGSIASGILKGDFTVRYGGDQIFVHSEIVAQSNVCFGTIYAPELINTDVQDIKRKEKDQGVLDIVRLDKVDKEKGGVVKCDRFKVTFEGKELPSRLKIGYSSYPVKMYYPAPMGCLICLRYGHMARHCKVDPAKATCRVCGGTCCLKVVKRDGKKKYVKQPGHVCKEELFCHLCPQAANNHKPGGPTCPAKKSEQKVIKLKIDKKLSYGEAKKRVTVRKAEMSYCNVLKNAVAGPSTSSDHTYNAVPMDEGDSGERLQFVKDKIDAVSKENAELEKQMKILNEKMSYNRELKAKLALMVQELAEAEEDVRQAEADIAEGLAKEKRKHGFESSSDDEEKTNRVAKKFGSENNVCVEPEQKQVKSGVVVPPTPVPARKVLQKKTNSGLPVATKKVIEDIKKRTGGNLYVFNKPFLKVQMYVVEKKMREEVLKIVYPTQLSTAKSYSHLYICEQGIVGSNCPLGSEK